MASNQKCMTGFELRLGSSEFCFEFDVCLNWKSEANLRGRKILQIKTEVVFRNPWDTRLLGITNFLIFFLILLLVIFFFLSHLRPFLVPWRVLVKQGLSGLILRITPDLKNFFYCNYTFGKGSNIFSDVITAEKSSIILFLLVSGCLGFLWWKSRISAVPKPSWRHVFYITESEHVLQNNLGPNILPVATDSLLGFDLTP